ncbi:DIMBOA UDP-glucosyltransferase BX9-like [Miscanthus floridulus]|uniref:DIMBOA UDP-glucosyltransferase BX9-like n=1 Tax=Miscanthus floridulus TaxID=154761 RepID=UPI00345A24ED
MCCLPIETSWQARDPHASPKGLSASCFTKRAICLGCFLAYPMLHQKGYLPPRESKLYMPVKELPPLRVRDLFYSSWSNHKKMRELLARANEAMKNSSGVVINTLDALETAELKRIFEELNIPMVLAPGPLHKLSSNSTRSSTMELDQDCSCIEWLDKQPSDSVLYVSFGSLASLDSSEFLEVAWGLANSGHPFLWVVRADSVRGFLDGPDFPNGFEAAVHGRGKVIRWAPQLEVLAHPAVGGFWTHSGWNSTLESISEGVAMICRPQFADQMMNTRYVVNTWGVGLELEGELERGKIEKAVRNLMKEKEGEEMRDRAKELKKNVADCLKAGGTSQMAIDKLVDYILSM